MIGVTLWSFLRYVDNSVPLSKSEIENSPLAWQSVEELLEELLKERVDCPSAAVVKSARKEININVWSLAPLQIPMQLCNYLKSTSPQPRHISEL